VRAKPKGNAMEFQAVDLKELVGITLGMLVVLIPVMGATIRFAAKPLIDVLVQSGIIGSKDAQAALNAPTKSELERLSRRVLELEQEVRGLKGALPAPVVALEADAPRPPELHRVR
jgi:hypothetical protein